MFRTRFKKEIVAEVSAAAAGAKKTARAIAMRERDQ